MFVDFRFFFLLIIIIIMKKNSSELKRMMKDSSDFGGSHWDAHISQLWKISIWKSGISLHKQHLVFVAELRLELYVQYTPKQFFRPLSSHFLEIIYLTDGLRHSKLTLPWDVEVSGVEIHTFFEVRRGSIAQRIAAACAEYCVVPVQSLWACGWWPGVKMTAWLPYEERSLVRSRKKKIELTEK